mgnify:FL=1
MTPMEIFKEAVCAILFGISLYVIAVLFFVL